MNISQSSNRRRMIAGASLIGLSLTFLSNILAGLLTEPAAPSQTIIALVGFVAVVNALLMAVALLGLSHLLRAGADLLGLAGAASALLGWATATRISALIQINALFNAGVEGVPASALESALKSAPVVWVSMFPVGLFFPLGIVLLGIALFRARPVNRWFGLLLALGGVLFPLGRAVGIESAVIACDIVLATAFAAIGWQILARPEVWEGTSSGVEITDKTLLNGLEARA